ncbi:MAG TPA: hypothetical protein VM864_13585 [Pyrinomonadaceae bacterium]|jgi:hypothetical protein|nr:hypothetical protein [Pyrinomonadaceae bacterium]
MKGVRARRMTVGDIDEVLRLTGEIIGRLRAHGYFAEAYECRPLANIANEDKFHVAACRPERDGGITVQ